jgi:hypothetical protein
MNWDFGDIGEIVWDGGGADNLASTKENWSTDTAPIATDNIHIATGSKNITWDIASTSGIWDIQTDYTGIITLAVNVGITQLYHNGTCNINGGGFALTVGTTTYVDTDSTLTINGATNTLGGLTVRGTLIINSGTVKYSGWVGGRGIIKVAAPAIIYDTTRPPALPIRIPMKIPIANGSPKYVGI